MAERSILVWDLETVPDLDAVARMLNMHSASQAELRAALGSDFPKHPLHRIVCIGALIASRRSEGWGIDSMGAPHIAERSEAELIETFLQRIGQLSPQLITYNGNSFDLPVLRYRAMMNRVSGESLQVRPYFHRYSDDALDLCDVLASYESRAKIKLDNLCTILGLSGKPVGVDGSQVEQLVNDGRIVEVAHYCESDVLNTYRVWLRYQQFRGEIALKQLEWSESQLREFVVTRKSSNPYILTVVGLEDASIRSGA